MVQRSRDGNTCRDIAGGPTVVELMDEMEEEARDWGRKQESRDKNVEKEEL